MLEKISEKKLKNLIVGISVAGTLLLFALLCVVVFQFVSMGIKNSQIKSYEAALARTEAEIAEAQGDLSYYESDEYKLIRAVGSGYKKP